MPNDKRRFIDQIPVTNQSDTIKYFFASTVDELFQPGQSNAISGYVGEQPVYYNPVTDFYIAEPTPERTAYQLEPTMISSNSGGIVINMLTYDDLVNYLASQGANVTNHSRMFEGDYYSWTPPVDIDKISNYLQYVWMGALTSDESNATSISLTAPSQSFSYDGHTATYSIPAAIPALGGQGESPLVTVNGVLVNSDYANNTVIIDTGGMTSGDQIKTYRYGDLTQTIGGSAQFNLLLFNAGSPVANATTGLRVVLHDAQGSRNFIIDGVGQSIEFSGDYTYDANGSTPQYVVIDRRSKEGSPWALRNLWVHQQTLAWSTFDFSGRVAARPIIEFLPNMELYNYGKNRVTEVQGMLSTTTADISDSLDVYPLDGGFWDVGEVTLPNINGQFLGRLHDANYGGTLTDTTYVGSVVVDNGYVLQPNDRLFVNQTNPTDPTLNNLIYTVLVSPNVSLPSGAKVDVAQLVVEGQPQYGDIVRVISNSSVHSSIFADANEYWYDGSKWNLAQSSSQPPLFRLYDFEQNPLDDASVYPGTNFSGNKIFSYKIGNGTVDPVLGFPIVYNSYNQPVFQIDSVSNRVMSNAGAIIGYYYQHFVDDNGGPGTFSNNWFPLANASTQQLSNGFYTIPLNLQANPGNQEVTTISQNQWFDQFSTIMTSQAGFVGQAFSANNWRDTAKVLDYGDEILQHRAPLLKTMLVSTNTNYDIPASLTYAELEYVRYRNKLNQTILTFYKNGTLQSTDTPQTWVDKILLQQKINQNSQFPFSYSSMAGGQYFMPPTPASLGVAPVATPALLTDTTYTTPITVLRGHDGSMTPAFNDFRDNIMLALELQIWNNIPSQFKTEGKPTFDLNSYISGKFYSSSLVYSQAELTQIVTPSFLRWVQANRLDYITNTTYDQNNRFTWNYSSCLDPDGEALPGNWRGIYYLYYDTDRPHLNPWEMLGFIEKPIWWDSQYGPAPYTAGNTRLWDDLTSGNIASGVRQGIDPRYARPGLYNYIPVDDEGNLLDPIDIGIVSEPPVYQQASADWKVGDYSPVEFLWRTSVSYGYALAQAGFLMKPARFVEQGWDTINQIQDSTGQWIYAPTGNRPTNSDIYVTGEINPVTNATVVNTGIQQWICDYIVSRGQKTSTFGEDIRGLNVQLAHKMAGFVSADNLSAAADNFGLVPAEDYSVNLYNSPAISEAVYSGVLVERTDNGWRVIGYDMRSPWFNIIPGKTTGPKGIITLATTPEPSYPTWRSNVRYGLNVKVIYQNALYNCKVANTSGPVFNASQWTLLGAVPAQAPRVINYLLGENYTKTIAYGTELTSYQEVADFLLGYGRYLVSIGWEFNNVNPKTQENINWDLMTKEFLGWAQVNWQTGNFITLSPAANEAGLTFNNQQGYVLNVLNSINGSYGMLDRAGLPISRRNVVVNRLDDKTILLSKNNDIYGARVNTAEVEHIILFKNTTIFNDVIYDPLYNLRQPRLLLIGFRSTNWSGRYDAPGFILINNQIKSNFYKSANDLLTMYDIEQGDNATLVDHARSIIGYDKRDYLTNLVLSEVEQFEFYQGMIKQKGAVGAFDKLLRSTYIDQNTNINFFEEWGILQSEYGAVDNKTRISFLFGKQSVLRDPQYVEFRVQDENTISNQPPATWLELVDTANNGIDAQWIERPTDPLMAFPQRSSLNKQQGDLPVAGYVRLDEITYTVFSSLDVPNLYDVTLDHTLQNGELVWIHLSDSTSTWDVLNSYNASANGAVNYIANVVTTTEDPTVANTVIRLNLYNPHGLTSADIGNYLIVDGVSGTQPELQGVSIINDIVGNNAVELSLSGNQGFDFAALSQNGPPVRVMRSVHFSNTTVFNANKSRGGFQSNDLAYVDGSPWRVYICNSIIENTVDIDGNINSNAVQYWSEYRVQAPRVDGHSILSSLVYDLKTNITTTDLRPLPLTLPDLTVISPLTGIAAGQAMMEIDYLNDYDPALYNVVGGIGLSFGEDITVNTQTTSVKNWGPSQVGRVWWDLSTVRYLETETDNVTFGITPPARYDAEVTYRTANWGSIAPQTSIDVYEWTRSLVDPITYTELSAIDTTGAYPGTVYNANAPSWVETQENIGNRISTYYYFWVKNLTVTPNVPFRSRSISDVAKFLINPITQDEPWVAPIMPNGLLIGGISPFVDDIFDYNSANAAISGTVVQIEVESGKNSDGVVHEEFLLLRPNDELSIPPNWLWDKLRDSLVGFNDNIQSLPVPINIPALTTQTTQYPVWYTSPNANAVPISQTM